METVEHKDDKIGRGRKSFMKRGSYVRVRLAGDREWTTGLVELVSADGKLIALLLQGPVGAKAGMVRGALTLMVDQATGTHWGTKEDQYQVEQMEEASITHHGCGMTSFHPKDVSEHYCGNCCRFLEAGEYSIQGEPDAE